MKKLMIFFLALTCVTANAQYNQSRTAPSPLLTNSYSKPGIVSSHDTKLSIPYFLLTENVKSDKISLSGSSGSNLFGSQSYWSGTTMTQYSLNHQLTTTQTFDQMGNLRQSGTTFTFKSRKKK